AYAGPGHRREGLGQVGRVLSRGGLDHPPRLGVELVLEDEEWLGEEAVELVSAHGTGQHRLVVDRARRTGRAVEVEDDDPRDEVPDLRAVAFHALSDDGA